MHRAQPVDGRDLVVEHELDVVLAVGHAEVDPTQRATRGTAAPRLFETKDLAVELQRGVELPDHHTDVAHPRRNTGRGQKLALLTARPPLGRVLHDLDAVAVGILDQEIPVADAARGRHRRHARDTLRDQVAAHRIGVVHLQRDVIQPVRIRRDFGPGKQLHALPVADFDRDHRRRGIRLRHEVGRLKAKEALVEGPRLGDIGDVEGGVGHAGDARTRRDRHRRRLLRAGHPGPAEEQDNRTG